MKRLINILLTLLFSISLFAQFDNSNQNTSVEEEEYVPRVVVPDTTPLYQGLNLKLDIGSPVLELATSKGKTMSFEGAINVNLKNRYLPTFEFGYARADASADGGNHYGQGGFARLGIDLSALKKSGHWNMLLVGVRVGTAVQQFELNDVKVSDPYWQEVTTTNIGKKVGADAWGEVLAGVQVQVYKNFHMGWYVRLKMLFTKQDNGKFTAYYIPGYGYRQDSNFGLNYYLGISF